MLTAVMRWFGSLLIFVLVLVGLNLVFGLQISIIGSVVLTLVLNAVFSLFSRR
jgi:hypothetical protein